MGDHPNHQWLPVFTEEDRAVLVEVMQTARDLKLILEKIMATLTDVQAAVTAEDSVIDSAIALLQGLAAQVAALPPNQAAIDALAADITAKTSTLSAAVVANTGTTPGPVVAGATVKA